MRSRDIIVYIVSVTLAVALIITAGSRLGFINSQRRQMKLISNKPLENAPPSLAFATIAMGAFRGLVVDVLWMRADHLKEQGQFFDAKQLAEWITILQPRFAQVWVFQAWNMAYNISVAIPAEQADQRWMWIKNGYELLRDRAIPLNPKAISLYTELARIFQHKIGGLADDDQKYYKLRLAEAMKPLLSSPDNGLKSDDNKYYELLAEAPSQWSQIANDPNVAQFIKALKAADEQFKDDKIFVNTYLTLRQNPAKFPKTTFRVIDDFRGTQALKKFDIFAKAWALRHTWKLDPQLMLEINRKYGPLDDLADPNSRRPLDWRHPNVHAIYWAVKGLKVAGKKGVKKPGRKQYSADEVNTDRIVAHSLQALFRDGKIFIYEPPARKNITSSQQTAFASQTPPTTEKQIYLRPDLRMFEPYNNAIIKIINKYTDPNSTYESSHKVGHRNMLKNAVLSFYQAGHRREAQIIYNQLRQLYPRKEFKSPSVEVYVKKRLADELENITITNAVEIIQSMLREAYFRLAVHDDDTAAAREQMAEQMLKDYRKHYSDEERLELPDFTVLRYTALLDFFNDRQYPLELRQTLLARIKNERPKLAEKFQQLEQKMLKEAQEAQKKEKNR